MTHTVRIGLLGLGNVGGGVVQILQQQEALIAARLGARLQLSRIATRHPNQPRTVHVPPELITGDVSEVLHDPDISIVAELIGGYEPARSYVLEALQQGKHVVTANKALLARHGQEIFRTANTLGREIGFEASVGGGIPIIRAIKEGLVANHFHSLSCIINGTSNYILSKMSERGEDFHHVLQEAQQLGYAEADPTFDVEGIDAAQKLALLASLAFGTWIDYNTIYTEGISRVSQLDIAYAREFGYGVKLLALAKHTGSGLDLRVHPALVSADSWLANVNGVYNAVNLHGDAVGRQMLIGRGAGPLPTGSAVVGDLIAIARSLRTEPSGNLAAPIFVGQHNPDVSLRTVDDVACKYYLHFQVRDQPGVLAAISGVLGEQHISIESVIQKGRGNTRDTAVSVVMMTHEARERDMRQALRHIAALPTVVGETMRLRVEPTDDD